jgi:predicted RNA-binding protein with RPS1 domain
LLEFEIYAKTEKRNIKIRKIKNHKEQKETKTKQTKPREKKNLKKIDRNLPKGCQL